MTVFEPNDPFLKKYVDSIYIFEKGQKEIKYTSYPSVNTAVGLFRNTSIEFSGESTFINESREPNFFGVAFNRQFRPVNIHYNQMVDEISVNFKPVGFSVFAQCQFPADNDCFVFTTWDDYLEELFSEVFSTSDMSERLSIIETFVLRRYTPIDDEQMLLRACELLNDYTSDYKMEDVAAQCGVHYKYLYRSFMNYVGCSPAYYRKIVKFRNAVFSRLNEGDALKFIELCYSNNYTDQPYFNKQFHEITGENPKTFFRNLSYFAKNKVFLKVF
jgi:AraC-like DNA-binding protein